MLVEGSIPGKFNKPSYIHVTDGNQVFVSDSLNHRIQILGMLSMLMLKIQSLKIMLVHFIHWDLYGTCLTYFGDEGDQLGQLKYPKGITINQQNFIGVADTGNSRIQIYEQDGKFVKSFGVNGNCEGQFDGIEGICSTASGDLIVCDRENYRIQILQI